MKANIDIQVVWNENRGVVQLFIGDFALGLPPVLCEQLERDLAAARRIPELARAMADDAAVVIPETDINRCVVGGPSGPSMGDAKGSFRSWSPEVSRDAVLRGQYST
jgi:hypothetical protein